MIDTNIYYSVCCQATMPYYPDNDICPKCGEHTTPFTQDEIDAEEESVK